MKINNKISKIKIIAALLCLTMLLSACLYGCNGSASDETPAAESNADEVEVVIAAVNISAGEKITPDKVETVLMDSKYLPEGTILADSDVVGKFAKGNIYKGEFFLADKISKNRPGSELDNSADTNGDGAIDFSDAGYIVVTDHLVVDSQKDMTDDIQRLIDENPGRTIYFPDGIYTISKPLTTSADPEKAVSLKLSNFAQIKADSKWTRGEPLIKLGATDMKDGITNADNRYSVDGGVFDCSGLADGIWVMNAGTVDIRYSAIKSAVVGVWIKADENGNGPVVDVYSVSIVGNNTTESKGFLIDTDGNTLTNINPGNIYTGVEITGTQNVLRNVHPLYVYLGALNNDAIHAGSVAFKDFGECNIYDSCYSDQMATAFYLGENAAPIIDGAFIFWYRATPTTPHRAIVCEGQFNAIVRSSHADFGHSLLSHEMTAGAVTTECIFLTVGAEDGKGVIDACHFDSRRVSASDCYDDYSVNGPIIS